LLSDLLPPLAGADLSDHPPSEHAPPSWSLPLVPNLSDWLPGDIVLVETDGSAFARAVELAQATSLNSATRAGSAFTHAAVYVGADVIIDNTLAYGIAERSVSEYCQNRRIALRSIPGITDLQRGAIVAQARQYLGQSYSWWGVAISKLIPKTTPNPDQFYCSTLVAHAVRLGCGINLTALLPYRPIYPGTLSSHPSLDKVQLEWRPVV
jgi:uncharacterized protein YycO